MSVLSAAIIGLFALWWFNLAHIPHNFSGRWHLIDALLYLAVSYVIWHPMVMMVLAWVVALHIKELPKLRPARGARVAFITNFVPASEPIELLEKNLPAMVKASYKHDTWLLDEGDDPAVKALCERLGVHHYSRRGQPDYNTVGGKFAAKTKGGNHNSWYDRHGANYDFVAQIDTDFIPRKDFLTKTLGYFKNPKIAFVGTPQIYGNTAKSLIARGAAEQSYIFYGPFLRGLCGLDSSLLIGANHIIRVAALKSVDHYSAHITEDLLTGMKLHADGWQSVYVSEPLAVGEGPTAWRPYFNQQMRWAYGCIDILWHHSPRLLRRMSYRRAIYYAWLQQYYFTGLAMALGIIGLVLYFGLGISTATLDMRQFLLVYLPAISICGFMALWLQRFNVRPRQERGLMVAGAIASLAAWPIFFLAFICVLRRKHLVYKVTPKGMFNKPSHELHIFKPHFVVALIGGLALASSFFTHRQSWVMMFWAGCITGSMALLPFMEDIYQVSLRVRSAILLRAARLKRWRLIKQPSPAQPQGGA
ncbi:MAG TPA: glycosyltransferase family 2 protein [Candidatus Saccharimonadia bacterium]|nr:glycosyltransferase family 2 protein [Candidatus Saccharimonadia bacterium]